MSVGAPKARLQAYLDERLFQSILTADPQAVEPGERLALVALQDRTRERRDGLFACGSAQQLASGFRRAWHSAEAVEARRGLARLGRPVSVDVWDGFAALARELGLRADAEVEPLPELQREAQSRIRARARALWEQDGRPTDREAEYLERARELEAIADHPDAGLMPNPITEADRRPSTEQPVEPVEQAVENQADIPGRMTDQGEPASEPTHRAARSVR